MVGLRREKSLCSLLSFAFEVEATRENKRPTNRPRQRRLCRSPRRLSSFRLLRRSSRLHSHRHARLQRNATPTVISNEASRRLFFIIAPANTSATPTPSFRTKQADAFSSHFTSCEMVGLRRENRCPIARTFMSDEISPLFVFRACALAPSPSASPPPSSPGSSVPARATRPASTPSSAKPCTAAGHIACPCLP
jgi:hypothetical protein